MKKSHLFYQTRDRKPLLDRSEGIYMWDTSGKKYIDGSSGAMVSNIGHSNPRVLDAMKTQMARLLSIIMAIIVRLGQKAIPGLNLTKVNLLVSAFKLAALSST